MREWYQKYKYRFDVGVLLVLIVIFILFLTFILKEFYLWSARKENAEREIQAILERQKHELLQFDKIIQAKKSGFQNEIQSLIKRREELTADNNELNQRKTLLNKEILNRETVLASLDKKMKDLDSLLLQIQERNKELVSADQRLQVVNGQLQAANINYADLIKKTSEQQDMLKNLTTTSANAKKQISELTVQIDLKSRQLTQLKESVVREEQFFQQTQLRVQKIKADQQALSKNLDKVKELYVQAKVRLESLDEKVKSTEAAKASLDIKNTESINEKNKQDNAIAILKKENDSLMRQQDSLKKSYASLQKEKALLEKQIKELIAASNRENIAYVKAQQKNQFEQNALKKLSQEKEQAIQSLNKIRREHSSITDDYNTVADLLEKSKKELEIIKKQHKELSAENLSLKEEQAEIRGRLKGLGIRRK